MGRRAYAPPNAPGEARASSPRVYVRWLPGALVPAVPCAHAAAQSAQPPTHANCGELWKELVAQSYLSF